MSWNDPDDVNLFYTASKESVPDTMPGAKPQKGQFGIQRNPTAFQSPTNNDTTASLVGIVRRNVSQGRVTSSLRGNADMPSTASGTSTTRNVIVPGRSLSINQQTASKPQVTYDGFNRVQLTNARTAKPELDMTSKSSTNYNNFKQNMRSNNTSPNQPSPNAPPLNSALQRLQPATTTTKRGEANQSTDLVFLANPSRTTTTSATTNRPSSRNGTQTKGTERHTIQSYEAKLECTPRSRQPSKDYPISNNLPSRPKFEPPYKNTTMNANSNTRSTRNSARKSPSNEVIDLVDDSDIEEVESIHKAQQRQDSEIFRLYGSLPGFTDQQKRNAFSKTEERLPVHHIYLGIYRFDSSNNSNSSARKLYLRVDGGNNQCILLGLNNDTDTVNTSDPDGSVSTEPIEIEEIPFDKIKKIM